MALKKKDKSQVMRKPVRSVITGMPSVGKSTAMGTIAKKALFIDLDKRMPKNLIERNDFAEVTETFKGVKEYLNDILNEPKLDNDWLVFDTATKLMSLVEAWTIQQDCKGDREKYNAYGGHGLRFAPQYFQEILDTVDKIQEKHQIHVTFICHSKLKSFKNPIGEDYVKNVLDLPEIVADRLKQWADCIGMAYFDVTVDKEKHKLINEGKRVITFNNNPLHEAKNGLAWALPGKILFDQEGKWAELVFQGSYAENRDLVNQIDNLIGSYPIEQRGAIRAKFETIVYRAMSAKELQPYIEAANKAKEGVR